jgi:hypothetical protein
MRLLKNIFMIMILLLLSCGSGGPVTPAESFNIIKNAVEKKDAEAVVNCLSESSLYKISKLNQFVKEMRSDQLSVLSSKYGYPAEKLKNMKPSDAAALYFFSDVTGVRLNRYFMETIISIDIQGGRAAVKTESGIGLDFVREGPYWKFDLSDL